MFKRHFTSIFGSHLSLFLSFFARDDHQNMWHSLSLLSLFLPNNFMCVLSRSLPILSFSLFHFTDHSTAKYSFFPLSLSLFFFFSLFLSFSLSLSDLLKERNPGQGGGGGTVRRNLERERRKGDQHDGHG